MKIPGKKAAWAKGAGSLLVAFLLLGAAGQPGAAEVRRNTLKVLTINVWSGLDYSGFFRMGEYETKRRREARFRSLLAQVERLSPDVILVQEANPVGRYTARLAAALSMDEVHQVVNGGVKVGPFGFPVNLKEGLAILARPDLEIVKAGAWKLSGSPGLHTDPFTIHINKSVLALVGSIRIGGRDVYLVDVHLVAAPNIPSEQSGFRETLLASGEMDEEGYEKGLEVWRQRHRRRAKEVEALLARIDQLPEGAPCIVGGDFNAGRESLEIRVFQEWGGFTEGPVREVEAFTWDPVLNGNLAVSLQHTNARGKTRKGVNLMTAAASDRRRRLDYIFLKSGSPGVEITDSRIVLREKVEGVQASDHFGVLAEIRFNWPEENPLEEGGH